MRVAGGPVTPGCLPQEPCVSVDCGWTQARGRALQAQAAPGHPWGALPSEVWWKMGSRALLPTPLSTAACGETSGLSLLTREQPGPVGTLGTGRSGLAGKGRRVCRGPCVGLGMGGLPWGAPQRLRRLIGQKVKRREARER